MSESEAATAFTDWRAKKKRKRELGQRGKKSESTVKSWLDDMKEQYGTRFAWDRPVDTREAGNMVKATVGDFDLMFAGRLLTMEVKETAAIEQLPSANFKRPQISRLYLRSLAGVPVVVVIHHTGETADYWCVSGIKPFFDQKTGAYSTKTMRQFLTAKEALDYCTSSLFN